MRTKIIEWLRNREQCWFLGWEVLEVATGEVTHHSWPRRTEVACFIADVLAWQYPFVLKAWALDAIEREGKS